MPKLTVSLDTDLPLWHRSAEKLIVLLEIHEPQVRQAAREQLVAMGQSVIPAIEEALETASALPFVDLAEILACSGSPVAIRPLLLAYARSTTEHRPSLYQELKVLLGRYTLLPDTAWKAIQTCTVRTAPLVSQQIKMSLALPLDTKDSGDPLSFREATTATEIASLTALLRWQRTGDVARQVALALHQIALSDPVPQLREALPYLHRAWHICFAHPELLQALKAIEEATVLWKDLPLPAESKSDFATQNLPVPVDNSH
jgi:hypothetical protein